MSTLNERIKERRIASGLTLLEVSQKIGVQEATMQRYESGQIKNIKHETVLSLSEVFNCSPSYLMGWANEPSLISETSLVNSAPLSSDECALIDAYRSLSDSGKQYMLQTATMAKNTYPECKSETVHIFRAASSERNADAQVLDVPREIIKKFKAARAVQSDDDI